jgi:HAD superfamily hydrolase (TIGR01509 family)
LINTFIFDLGGVIIDLEERDSYDSLSKIVGLSLSEIQSMVSQSVIFNQHQKGLISNDVFRKGINDLFQCNLSDHQIDIAWNAMLKKIPIERLDLLLALRKNYKVLVLSNTNSIHIRRFNEILMSVSGKKSLDYFADYVFFSHELNMRKPDMEIYEEVLKRSNSEASESIFMDDKLENLKSAASIGISTFHVSEPDKIFELKKYV